jgi:hypothetical protein
MRRNLYHKFSLRKAIRVCYTNMNRQQKVLEEMPLAP